MTALTLMPGLMTAARDLYVGREFGYSPIVQGYLLWTVLPVLVVNSIGGALSTTFTPWVYRSQVRGVPPAALGRMAFDAAVLSLAAFLALTALRSLASASPPDHHGVGVIHLVGIIAVGTFARTVQAMLLGQERYVLSTLLQCMVPGGMMVALIAMRPIQSAASIVNALALGYGSQAALALWLSRTERVTPIPGPNTQPRAPDRGPMRRMLAATFAAALVLALMEYIEIHYARQHADAAVPAVSYASRFVTLILGIVMAGTGNVLTLKFIDVAMARGAARDAGSTIRALRRLTTASAALGAVAATLLVASAPTLVDVLYARSAMSSTDRAELATLLRWYALAIPFALIGFAAGRALVAHERQHTLFIAALLTLTTTTAANIAFRASGLPLASVVVASVLGYAASSIVLLYQAYLAARPRAS